jgi:hypothetical protein
MTFTSYSKVFNQATGIVTFTITATKEQGTPKETRQLTLLRKRIGDNPYMPVCDKVSIEIQANETQKSVELTDSTKTFWPQATYLY